MPQAPERTVRDLADVYVASLADLGGTPNGETLRRNFGTEQQTPS